MKREKLIPKKVTDKNGRMTTVYVRADASGYSQASPGISVGSRRGDIDYHAALMDSILGGELDDVSIHVDNRNYMEPEVISQYLEGSFMPEVVAEFDSELREEISNRISSIEESEEFTLTPSQFDEASDALHEAIADDRIHEAMHTLAKQTADIPLRTGLDAKGLDAESLNQTLFGDHYLSDTEENRDAIRDFAERTKNWDPERTSLAVVWKGNITDAYPDGDASIEFKDPYIVGIHDDDQIGEVEELRITGDLNVNTTYESSHSATVMDTDSDAGIGWGDATGSADYEAHAPKSVKRVTA